MKNLQIFTHISTAYVNSNVQGLIREEIIQKYAQQEFNQLQRLTLNEIITNTKQILGGFPNTYTFTKNLCQRLLKKRQGNIPLCIIRPTCINPSYQQPFPGWVDSVAATSKLYMYIGLGKIHDLIGNLKYLTDTIPVDIVVSNIIVATGFNLGNTKLNIYHVGSSYRNPQIWKESIKEVTQYWKENTSKYKLSEPSFCLSDNQIILNLRRWKRRIPFKMHIIFCLIFKKELKNKIQSYLNKLDNNEKKYQDVEHFLANEWIFQSKNIDELLNFLTDDDRTLFKIDVTQLNMKSCIWLANYGMQRYILKQKVNKPQILSTDENKRISKFIDIEKNKSQKEQKIQFSAKL